MEIHPGHELSGRARRELCNTSLAPDRRPDHRNWHHYLLDKSHHSRRLTGLLPSRPTSSLKLASLASFSEKSTRPVRIRPTAFDLQPPVPIVPRDYCRRSV